MLLGLSALAAIVLLLLALRLTQRLTLRFKLVGGVSVSRQPQKSCPHLGASADPFTHDHQPSDDHAATCGCSATASTWCIRRASASPRRITSARG